MGQCSANTHAKIKKKEEAENTMEMVYKNMEMFLREA